MPLWRGSGVRVSPDYILTAQHVAPDSPHHNRLDIALVSEPIKPGEATARLSFRQPQEGEELMVIGFGGDGQTRWSSKGLQSDQSCQCTCNGWYGDSGGGVFDESGRLIGIMVGLDRDMQHHETVSHHLEYVPLHDAKRWLIHHGLHEAE